MKRKKGKRLSFSLWATEERGKDLNLSGRSYDKNTEVGDRAGLIRHRKRRINQVRSMCFGLSVLIKAECLVGVRIWGRRSAVVRCIHERRQREGRSM